MVNYQNGKIYKIESFIGNVVYYGSTCQLLCRRLAKHRNYMNEPHRNITSKQVLEHPDAKIYLVELYPCNSKAELHSREGYYIKNNDCVNKNIAGRTRTYREYYIDNKESILGKAIVYRENNKEKIKLYRENNKEKNKQYQIDNKESISQYSKVYRGNNKEKIKLHKTKPYTCECGKTIQWDAKARHNKSQYHIKFVNNLI